MLEAPDTLAGKIVFNTMLSADCLMTEMRVGFFYVSYIFHTVTRVVVDLIWLIWIWGMP